jgi:hypothetical protein
MNEVIKAIIERRSVRKYTDEPVSREELDQIIEAGLYAASARNRQDVIIVAVTNREVRDRLSRANCEIGGWTESTDPFFGAPAVLIVLADKQFPNHVYDGSLVIGNMMLAATPWGWAAAGSTGQGRSSRQRSINSSSGSLASRETGRASATASWATWPATRRKHPAASPTGCITWNKKKEEPRLLSGCQHFADSLSSKHGSFGKSSHVCADQT